MAKPLKFTEQSQIQKASNVQRKHDLTFCPRISLLSLGKYGLLISFLCCICRPVVCIVLDSNTLSFRIQKQNILNRRAIVLHTGMRSPKSLIHPAQLFSNFSLFTYPLSVITVFFLLYLLAFSTAGF